MGYDSDDVVDGGVGDGSSGDGGAADGGAGDDGSGDSGFGVSGFAGDAGDSAPANAAPGDYSGPTVDAGVFVGRNADGTTMTVPTWGGEKAHIWHEGHNPDNPIRSVADQQGNVVAWDTRTGQVTTAIHEQQGVYSVSTDLPSFDE